MVFESSGVLVEPMATIGYPLWGLRVLKFDGAIAPRVLRFDAPPARGLWWRL